MKDPNLIYPGKDMDFVFPEEDAMDDESTLLAAIEIYKDEIKKLHKEKELIIDILATWANEEGIGFDQTERLSRMLENAKAI